MVNIIETIERFIDEKKYDEITPMVDAYFNKHSQEIDLRTQLAIFFNDPPIADQRISIRLLEEVLAIDPENAIALVVLAFTYDRLWSGISEELYNQLGHAKIVNDEEKGMIELAKSWYYARTNDELYEKYLLSSIKYGNKFVWNYRDLADLYLKKGHLKESQYYLQKALNNIQKVYTIKEIQDDKSNKLTTIEGFLNELVKGTVINEIQREFIYDMLME